MGDKEEIERLRLECEDWKNRSNDMKESCDFWKLQYEEHKNKCEKLNKNI